jgi:hypothetical protein
VNREKHRQLLGQQGKKYEEVLFDDLGESGFPSFTAHYAKVWVKKSAEHLRNLTKKVRLVENCGTFFQGEL